MTVGDRRELAAVPNTGDSSTTATPRERGVGGTTLMIEGEEEILLVSPLPRYNLIKYHNRWKYYTQRRCDHGKTGTDTQNRCGNLCC